MIHSKYAPIALASLHACVNGIDAYAQWQNAHVSPTDTCFRRVHET